MDEAFPLDLAVAFSPSRNLMKMRLAPIEHGSLNQSKPQGRGATATRP
jgi:hypothetical protein